MSPTVQTLLLGFVTLAVFVAIDRWRGRSASKKSVLLGFFPAWLAYCLWHLSVGLDHGYSLLSELPFLALNFGVPALVAVVFLKRSS